ncbi:MAG: alpha/beta hydrolase domain-containing protein [Actinomycetota bacterium]|nr:hypothetical protein [Acidimicrobiia bacterium]MDQ3293068.1 alpha/beta hydrolase domain-containing protein [Actinomycetota bacterium]
MRGRTAGAHLAAISCLEEEWFVAGDASAYATDGELAPDGRWSVTPASTAPFRTRLLVRRPRDPQRFSVHSRGGGAARFDGDPASAAPRSAPAPITTSEPGSTTIERDEHGLALGGIPTPSGRRAAVGAQW